MADRKPHTDNLVREYEIAWKHYRHAETLRSQHLGFFFTITFAFLAYAGTTGQPALDEEWRSVLLAALAFLITILACLTLISVRKLGVVLDHYQRVTFDIRACLLESDPELGALLMATHAPPRSRVLRSRLFTVQGAAEFTLAICAFTSTFVEVALAAHFILEKAEAGTRVLLTALALVSLAMIVGLLLAGKRPYYLYDTSKVAP